MASRRFGPADFSGPSDFEVRFKNKQVAARYACNTRTWYIFL